MSQKEKAKKVGRPKLPKGDAKARIVPVRFSGHELKRMTAAAKASKQSLSEWVRSKLNAEIQK